MAQKSSWSQTISLVRQDQAPDRQRGQLVDGRIIYSPKFPQFQSKNLVSILYFRPERFEDDISHVQMPFWWCSKLAYLAFTCLNPQCADSVPFEDPITLSVSFKAKKMQPDMESRISRHFVQCSTMASLFISSFRYSETAGPPISRHRFLLSFRWIHFHNV
jgi:hypothetical protein